MTGRAAKAAGATATYAYCVVRSSRPPALSRVPPGLPGAGRVRALPIGDASWLIAADVPLARYGDDAVRPRLGELPWVSAVAMAHESVVAHFRRADALLPLKLFTLFSSDARALAAMRRDRRRLDRVLDRVAGRDEWGVRVVVDPRRALARARERAGPARQATGGTAFLLRKKAERDTTRRARLDIARLATELHETLARHADDARRRAPSAAEAPALALEAAYLVPASRARRFRAVAHAAARRLHGEGHRVSLTGPWPTYTFMGDAPRP